MTRFDAAIAEFDAANAEDPNRIATDAGERPAELVYAERMSQTLARLHPHASEPLRLAARAQHIRRWTVPRATYPKDRAGYLHWRNDLKRRHADIANGILAACGYPADDIGRVEALIRKENLKSDGEAQALEDVACLVFLEHYAAAFLAKHDAGKVHGILRKTWGKMSAGARSAALDLALAPPVRVALEAALAAGPQP